MSGGLLPDPSVTNPVGQSGDVTPGHLVSWTTDGIVQDAGTAATTGPYLPIVGGTLTGQLVINPPPVISPLGLSAPPVGYVLDSTINYDLPSSATGIYFGTAFKSFINGTPTTGNTQVWTNFWQLTAQTGPTAHVDLVNGYFQTVRPAGWADAQQALQCVVMELRDQTNSPSSVAGGLQLLELDLSAGDVDDGNKRRALAIAIDKNVPGDTTPTFDSAVYVTNSGSGGYFQSVFRIASGFSDAVLDTRAAGNPAGAHKSVVWMLTGHNIAFDTGGSTQLFGDGVRIHSTVALQTNGGVYLDTSGNVSISGDGTNVITRTPFQANFSSNVAAAMLFTNGSSGAFATSIFNIEMGYHDAVLDTRGAGTAPGGHESAVWMLTGQNISFDTGGTNQLFSDGTKIFSSVPVIPPNYTVANLPATDASHQGALAFARNARNFGEGGGGGTGCLVTTNNVGNWVAVWSGVAPTT